MMSSFIFMVAPGCSWSGWECRKRPIRGQLHEAGSIAREDSPESAEVGSVPGLLSREPVLRSPEQVRVQRSARLTSQDQAPVVVLDHALRRTARHRPSLRAGWSGDRLPRFGLSLADHQPPALRRGPPDHAPGALSPRVAARVQVDGQSTRGTNRVAVSYT